MLFAVSPNGSRRLTWFWSSPEWEKYSAAYGSKTDNVSPDGNLVLNLDRPIDDLWSVIRKGHRADIRHAEKIVSVGSWHESFADYQRLHLLDAGRLTRPQETFDLMQSWIPDNALLAIARVDGQAMGAAYFIRYDGGAYYASAARHPEAPRGIAHLLVWYAMLCLRFDCTWLDLGPVPAEDATEKEKNIFHFKAGFGGAVRTWPY